MYVGVRAACISSCVSAHDLNRPWTQKNEQTQMRALKRVTFHKQVINQKTVKQKTIWAYFNKYAIYKCKPGGHKVQPTEERSAKTSCDFQTDQA